MISFLEPSSKLDKSFCEIEDILCIYVWLFPNCKAVLVTIGLAYCLKFIEGFHRYFAVLFFVQFSFQLFFSFTFFLGIKALQEGNLDQPKALK